MIKDKRIDEPTHWLDLAVRGMTKAQAEVAGAFKAAFPEGREVYWYIQISGVWHRQVGTVLQVVAAGSTLRLRVRKKNGKEARVGLLALRFFIQGTTPEEVIDADGNPYDQVFNLEQS